MIEFKREEYYIRNCRIILKDIPYKNEPVIICGLNEVCDYRNGLECNEYYVDYDLGIVYLSKKLSCNSLEVSYYAILPYYYNKIGENPPPKSPRPGFKTTEEKAMNKFCENFKIFMSHYKIKQSILVIKTGYGKNKLSRLLSGKQQLKVNDMQALSKAVGKSVDFFISEMNLDKGIVCNDNEIAFSAGVPTPEKTDYANKLFDLLENIDLILGMEKKISQCNMNEV